MQKRLGATITLWSAVALAAAGCGGGGGNTMNNPPPTAGTNAAPTVSGIPDQSVDEDSLTDPIEVVVADAETDSADLVVDVTSSDAMLLPSGGIDVVGGGSQRILTVVPAAGQSGTADVTVTVTDPQGASASSRFQLTVNALYRAEFAGWMRGTVLAQGESDDPVGAPHDDGSPLGDTEDILRIKFSDATAADPAAYDDLVPPDLMEN